VGTTDLRQVRLVNAVRSSPLLGRLSSDDLAEVLAWARSVVAHRGDVLRRAEDDSVLVVLAGAAISTTLTTEGAEIVTGLLGPGSVAGLAVVMGQTEAGTDIVALDDAEALLLPGPEFRRAATTLSALAIATMRTLAAEVAQQRSETARFTDTSTTQRVLDRLVELGDHWSRDTDHGLRITVPLTQDMLASWSRASRESTAKVLHELRRAGVIRTGRRELTILDLDRLRARGSVGSRRDDAVRTLLRSIS
jgi:CRP/FNR family cyclic AMP-dependent transcriptional regulator